MEVTGVIKVKGETQTFGTFQKREFVVTTDDQYPQDIALELHQDKCGLIDGYYVGDTIKTSINLRGKEWQNPKGGVKYFNTIVGWRIEKMVEGSVPPPPNEPLPEAAPDDLPF